RRRNAETLRRGDTLNQRDLEDLAEGYLEIMDLLETECISDQMRCAEEEDAGNERIGAFRVAGEDADIKLVVPVTRRIYDALTRLVEQDEVARKQDTDTGAALIALALLQRGIDLMQAAEKFRTTLPPPT